MSYDLSSIAQTCDHLILLERYRVSVSDFQTLQFSSPPAATVNMRAPINGVAMLKLFIKGVQVSPTDPNFGYSIVPDPSRVLADYVFSKIIFNQPVRQVGSLIEVTYFTREDFCLKCGGTGQVIDWQTSQSGGLLHTFGDKKLSQQVFKYILTSINPFNPNLTCPIRSYVGKKFGLSITDQDISSAVTTALATYQTIQAAQKTVQTLSPQEMIKNVTSVEARQDPTDPLTIYLALQVTVYGLAQPIPLNITLQTNS
jgi:hypothetical protein